MTALLREQWRETRQHKTALDEDYRGGHQPMEDGDPLDDLGTVLLPPDVYDHPEWYAFGRGEPYYNESIRVVRQMRGKPNATVTIYRAAPPGVKTFNTGDWVAVSEAYARQHAISNGDEDWPVYSAQVPAHSVRHGGNDLIEWGYWGPAVPARVVR